jgi:hypothetical protein
MERNKSLLFSFLNFLLKGNPSIKDLHLENTDISKILEEDKASRHDVKATSDDGMLPDVEIQCSNTGETPQRAFHYLANMMPGTVKSGASYKGPKVIGEAYMTFQPSDPDPYQIMTDAARIFFIELPKFNPKKADAKDLLTAWLSFLKDPIFMDESFLRVKEVKDTMETLKYISSDDETRAIANLRQKTINDHNSEITVAKEEGREEGREEGIAIGEERGKAVGELKKARETARNLLSMGLSAEQISEATGLSNEEITKLLEN